MILVLFLIFFVLTSVQSCFWQGVFAFDPCGRLARVLCREMICVCLVRRKTCQSLYGWWDWVLLLRLCTMPGRVRFRSILEYDGDGFTILLVRSRRYHASTKMNRDWKTWKEQVSQGLMPALVQTDALADRLPTLWAARVFFVQKRHLVPPPIGG